jgi:phosphohistidine phosphatase
VIVVLVRHGEAEPKSPAKPDKDRDLTQLGLEQARRAAKVLKSMKLLPDSAYSSPYLRAKRTAETIVEELGLKVRVEPAKELEPDGDPDKLKSFLDNLSKLDGERSVLMVSHEPFLSTFVKSVTGGNVKLGTGGIAVIEYSSEGSTLLALIPQEAIT